MRPAHCVLSRLIIKQTGIQAGNMQHMIQVSVVYSRTLLSQTYHRLCCCRVLLSRDYSGQDAALVTITDFRCTKYRGYCVCYSIFRDL